MVSTMIYLTPLIYIILIYALLFPTLTVEETGFEEMKSLSKFSQ